jgi:hypothetical protein
VESANSKISALFGGFRAVRCSDCLRVIRWWNRRVRCDESYVHLRCWNGRLLVKTIITEHARVVQLKATDRAPLPSERHIGKRTRRHRYDNDSRSEKTAAATIILGPSDEIRLSTSADGKEANDPLVEPNEFTNGRAGAPGEMIVRQPTPQPHEDLTLEGPS